MTEEQRTEKLIGDKVIFLAAKNTLRVPRQIAAFAAVPDCPKIVKYLRLEEHYLFALAISTLSYLHAYSSTSFKKTYPISAVDLYPSDLAPQAQQICEPPRSDSTLGLKLLLAIWQRSA